MPKPAKPELKLGDYVRLTAEGLQRMQAAGLLHGWDGVSPKLLCDIDRHPEGNVALLEPPRTLAPYRDIVVPVVFLQPCEDLPSTTSPR